MWLNRLKYEICPWALWKCKMAWGFVLRRRSKIILFSECKPLKAHIITLNLNENSLLPHTILNGSLLPLVLYVSSFFLYCQNSSLTWTWIANTIWLHYNAIIGFRLNVCILYCDGPISERESERKTQRFQCVYGFSFILIYFENAIGYMMPNECGFFYLINDSRHFGRFVSFWSPTWLWLFAIIQTYLPQNHSKSMRNEMNASIQNLFIYINNAHSVLYLSTPTEFY